MKSFKKIDEFFNKKPIEKVCQPFLKAILQTKIDEKMDSQNFNVT